MDARRRQQLKEEAKNRTDEENQLLHVLYIHVTDAYTQLLIANAELEDIEEDRAQELSIVIDELLGIISALTEKFLRSIPGVMTPEELEEELKHSEQHATVNWALRPTATEEEDESTDTEF